MDTGEKNENISVNAETLPLAFTALRLEGERLSLVSANSLFYQLIGYTPGEYEALTPNKYGWRLAADQYAEGLVSCIRGRASQTDVFPLSMELTAKNGECVRIRANMTCTGREDDTLLINCVFEDMEDVGAAFMSSVQKMDRLDTVVSISANAIFEYSSVDKTLKIFTNLDGHFTETEAISEDFEQNIKDRGSVYEDDLESFEQLCENIRGGIDRAAFELRFSGSSGYRWYRVKMKTVKDENDPDRFKVIGKMEDVSDLKNAEQRLIDKAERDPLTHIYNKATTKKLIKTYLRQDSRETFDAFIIIDVDNFKQINDTFGHLFGDSVLVDLSQEMQDLFRSNDVVGRIGGDEFIVFLRGLKNISHIENKANDICKVFDLLYSDDEGTKITGSLGIALFPRDGDTFDELYKRADTALYASKRAGKSCYTFYDKSKDVAELPSLPRVERYRSNMDILRQAADFDISLMNYALDVFSGKIDSESVDLLFRKAGKHFAISRISVYARDGSSFELKHQWCGKRVEPASGAFTFREEQLPAFTRSFDKNGIRGVENCGVSTGVFEKYLSERGVKSCLASAGMSDGKLDCIVSFEECVSTRLWSIEEARAADTLKRLYVSVLSKIL